MEIDSGGCGEGGFLSRRHGVEYEGHFPAEVCAARAAVHDDGFEVHHAMVTGRGQVDAESE